MNATRSIDRRSRRDHHGSAMILVLITVAIAFVVSLTFLAGSTTTTGVAQILIDHARARQVAESGLAMTVRYVQMNANWHDVRTTGAWISDLGLYDGIVSVTAEFPSHAPMSVIDASFEQAIGELSTPILAPPMSGTIGGWQALRTAVVATGPTVPRMSISSSGDAVDGSNVANISFLLGVNGSGTFAQTLTSTLDPNTVYEFAVDMKTSGLSILDGVFGFRIMAGNTTIASSDHATVMALPNQLPTPPSQPPASPELESMVEIVGLSGDFSSYTLRFVTDDAPAAGLMRVELFARSTLGVASSVTFDHVRLTAYPNEPLILTAVGRWGNASCRVSASMAAASTKVVMWSDFSP